MARNFVCGILTLALLGGAAASSAAQETGTPIFKAPYRAFEHSEIGLSLSDPGEGVGAAIEGFYRYGTGPTISACAEVSQTTTVPGTALLMVATSAPRWCITAKAFRSMAPSRSVWVQGRQRCR